jgi:hypothetical protein
MVNKIRTKNVLKMNIGVSGGGVGGWVVGYSGIRVFGSSPTLLEHFRHFFTGLPAG